jgi:hypothetical protein
MENHKEELSLVEDYYNRTKPQFENIEKEVDDYANSLYKNYPGTEYTDEASVAEWATEQGIKRYETLSTMRSNHLLMTISMLYHIWEQQLIRFTIRELRHYIRFDEKSVEYEDVQKIFELHGVDIARTKSWGKIRELKFLVNTIKHADGPSANKLRKIRPDFFELEAKITHGIDVLKLHGAVLLDSFSLQVKEGDLYDYIKATKNFWDEMPERAYSNTEIIISAFENKK